MLGVIPFVLVKSLRLKTKKNVLKNKKNTYLLGFNIDRAKNKQKEINSKVVVLLYKILL
jgi:hypothetical protein